MADDDTPVFQIQRMYLKDLSLEIPHAPQIFLEQAQPTVEVSIDSEAAQLAEGVFEVTVTVTVTTRVEKEKVVFLTEAKQAGIFELRNIPQEQMEMVLNIVCPNTIYPYLRSNVADVIQRAGFPPIHLAEINFEVLYQQKVAAAAQQVESAQSGQPGQSGNGAAGASASGLILPVKH
jgi:preprotein translocase subunit SecB